MKEVSFSEFYAFIDPMGRIEMRLEGNYPYTRVYSRSREIVAKSTATLEGGVYPPTRRYFIKSNTAEK